MNDHGFRVLLVASLVFGVVASNLDSVFPALLPDAFRAAQRQQANALSGGWLFVFSAVGLMALVLYVVSFYGLYRRRSWAPRLAVIGTVVAVFVWPLFGATAQSGVAASFSYVAWLMWGAVVVLSHTPRCSGKDRYQMMRETLLANPPL